MTGCGGAGKKVEYFFNIAQFAFVFPRQAVLTVCAPIPIKTAQIKRDNYFAVYLECLVGFPAVVEMYMSSASDP